MSPLLGVTLAFATLVATAALTMRASDGLRARAIATIGSAIGLGFATLAALYGRSAVAFSSLSLTHSEGAFGLDGLSAPLFVYLALTTLAIVASTSARDADPSRLARYVVTGALHLGLVASRRGDLFAAFWLASLVPLAVELRGKPGQRGFVALQLVGTIAVIASLATDPATNAPTRDALLLLAVAVRAGTFPFHAWIPQVFESAPIGSALGFVQAQSGAYLLARDLIARPSPSIALAFDGIAAASLVYGAALALAQRSARRTLGYLTVSQGALVVVGLADGGPVGAAGALAALLALGLAQVGFGLGLSAVEARRGTLSLDRDHGGHASTPALAGAVLVLGLASAGLPGTLGFVAEDLVFNTTLEARWWVAVAMIVATATNGATVLRCAFRLFGGKRRSTGEGDLTPRERLVLAGLGASLFALGLFPQVVLDFAHTSFEQLVPHDAASHGAVSEAATQPIDAHRTPCSTPRAGVISPSRSPRADARFERDPEPHWQACASEISP
jgi:NADH-quinone oxidoreductase subunit M